MYVKIDKNTNVPKFLMKIFEKYYDEVREEVLGEGKFFNMKKKINKMRYRNKDPNLLQLKNILNKEVRDGQGSVETRMIMWKIIQKFMKKEIINNFYVKSKMSYMITTKAYMLRCRSSSLIDRVQSRWL